MKRTLAILMACLFMMAVLVVMTAPAFAKITQTNNGGQEPKGNANGVPHTNPAGKEPPGQNKKQTGPPG